MLLRSKTLVACLLACAVGVAATGSAAGQGPPQGDAPPPAEPTPAELQQQILELQKQILQLEQQSLQELQRIRALLQQQNQQAARAAQPRKPVTVSIGGSPGEGSADAPVTIVEFTDYQCQYCARFYATIFPELKKNYIDTGKVRFVARELPLTMHKDAFASAVAARCAENQGKFWEMREIMFQNQQQLTADALSAYAESLDLDMERFAACRDAEEPKAAVNRDIADAHAVGIISTPSFVIGYTPNGSTNVTGLHVRGSPRYASLAAHLDKLLNGAADAAAEPQATPATTQPSDGGATGQPRAQSSVGAGL